MPEQPSWTTGMEIKFIKGIGTFAKESTAVKQCTRAELLTRYIGAANLRSDWTGIDRDKVIGFAEECLRHELPN